ncbi:hypothetical protein C8Q80DRAFT_282533 [Daedaleopsis nitida]|nr:hypothetical protein C8Q80DRAFT_282533 [Daedaleopsis nitida]
MGVDDEPTINLPGSSSPGRCHHSIKYNSGWLTRCGGCSIAVYCSKKCQKAAWPAHKASVSTPSSSLDRTSSSSCPSSTDYNMSSGSAVGRSGSG